MLRGRRFASICVLVLSAATAAAAQDPPDPAGLALPTSDQFRVYFDLLGAGYQDAAQAPLGHESQGRIGWAIIGLTGTLNPHVSYVLEVNPADDSAIAKPACGESGYFYPNVPDPAGPAVACVPDGRDRVDLYRFIGLDPLTQQGMIRRAQLDVHTEQRTLGILLGRFVVPLGFNWLEMGSWTNQDAPLIQRLNAEASFGIGAYGTVQRGGRTIVKGEAAAYRGDAKRSVDYTYSVFVDEATDTNSDLTAAGRVAVFPTKAFEFRFSGKYGFNGSKVPAYPLFTLSKRKDHAVVASAQYRVAPWFRGFAEYAKYWTGLPATSATLVGLQPQDIFKPGYYAGVEATRALPKAWRVGVVATYEDISRNDSLVWALAQRGLYRASLGARVKSAAVRVSVRMPRNVELGYYFAHLDNPFPWLSGIVPVSGTEAFAEAPLGGRKWGFVFRLRVP